MLELIVQAEKQIREANNFRNEMPRLVRNWPYSDLPACPLLRRYRRKADMNTVIRRAENDSTRCSVTFSEDHKRAILTAPHHRPQS